MRELPNAFSDKLYPRHLSSVVAAILHKYPTSIHSFDRRNKEGFFDTVLVLGKPSLLKLAATVLVDGTLDADSQNNVLTTALPCRGKEILVEILDHYPPELAVEILGSMAFVKVPFADPRFVDDGDRIERGSPSYTDPWPVKSERRLIRSDKFADSIDLRGGTSRAAAVLPLPGLGGMDFLSSLLSHAPAEVFDNVPMALVVRTMWNDHIRVFFYLDFFIFMVFYACWVALVEIVAGADLSSSELGMMSGESNLSIITLTLNTLFGLKEVCQSRMGKRGAYWRSLWNYFDILAIGCVYLYILNVFLRFFRGDGHIPLSVVTSFILTVKLLSYLRGFGDTGWLISVLIANFRDVRGFLIILFTILMGFAIAFRALFSDFGDESFGSLRRAFLSTFELTITGSYDPTLIVDSEYSVLAACIFVLSVTCVLVVALNALISILADSYAKVQENAVANRRKEQAALIVEYMMLLPPRKRKKIEDETRWFHTLLEVDADGDLKVETDDWLGGLNALRRDVEKLSNSSNESTQRALGALKEDLGGEIQKLKRELASLIDDLSDDVKKLRKRQGETSGISFNGKNVARAVRAVKSVGQKGTALFGKKED